MAKRIGLGEGAVWQVGGGDSSSELLERDKKGEITTGSEMI